MSPTATLVLRDVHAVPVPPWWPLPPGWWAVIGVVSLLALLIGARQLQRRRQRRRWQRMFDTATAAADTPAGQMGVMAELLRRAARARQPGVELLEGPEWLRWLDTPGHTDFSQGEGQLLLDGAYRPQLDAGAVARVHALARERFVQLMTGRRA